MCKELTYIIIFYEVTCYIARCKHLYYFVQVTVFVNNIFIYKKINKQTNKQTNKQKIKKKKE